MDSLTELDRCARYHVGGYTSDEQRFELYAIGAPQSHGQNLYKQNTSTHKSSRSIDGYDDSAYVSGEKFGCFTLDSLIRIGS